MPAKRVIQGGEILESGLLAERELPAGRGLGEFAEKVAGSDGEGSTRRLSRGRQAGLVDHGSHRRAPLAAR
jgi:hypothetical protein